MPPSSTTHPLMMPWCPGKSASLVSDPLGTMRHREAPYVPAASDGTSKYVSGEAHAIQDLSQVLGFVRAFEPVARVIELNRRSLPPWLYTDSSRLGAEDVARSQISGPWLKTLEQVSLS